MAKKKVGRPKKKGKSKTTRVRVKGYTRIVAEFNGVARAHAKRIKVKGYTRERPKKRKKTKKRKK